MIYQHFVVILMGLACAAEAVAAALPEPGAASPRKGRGPAKKGGRKGKQEAPAEAQEEEPEDEATEEASEPPKTKGRGRPAKKQQPAKVLTYWMILCDGAGVCMANCPMRL